MFQNIGGELKSIARIFVYIGIIVCILAGILLCFVEQIVIGIVFIVLGSVSSWLSAGGLYALGELVENVQSINQKLHNYTKADSTSNHKSSVSVTNPKLEILKELHMKQLITHDEYEQKLIEIAPEEGILMKMFDVWYLSYENGDITKEEYQAKKAELLAKL